MVTSLQLARVVAQALGLPEGTVVQHLRNLQKERLIEIKGRGRGAAIMSPSDAAKLLIATSGSDLVKDSVDVVRRFGGMLPVVPEGRPRPQVTFLDHVSAMLVGIGLAGGADPAPEPTNVAFRLISAAEPRSGAVPSAAVSRRATNGRWGGVLSFAPPDVSKPVLAAADLAVMLRGRGSGLVRVTIVTMEACEIVAAAI